VGIIARNIHRTDPRPILRATRALEEDLLSFAIEESAGRALHRLNVSYDRFLELTTIIEQVDSPFYVKHSRLVSELIKPLAANGDEHVMSNLAKLCWLEGRHKNEDILTNLGHDLRTPLSVIGLTFKMIYNSSLEYSNIEN
jgi:hypothetical protein